MVAKVTMASGAWNAAVWSPSGVPTVNDAVTIAAGHVITPPSSGAVAFGSLMLNGSLELDTDVTVGAGGVITIGATGQIYRRRTTQPTQRRISSTGAYTFELVRTYPDARRIDLGGYRLDGVEPSLGCSGSSGPYPAVATLRFSEAESGDWWLTDQGFPSAGAALTEQGNEGVGENYVRWSKGKARSARTTVRWPKIAGSTAPYSYDYGEMLRRYAQSPYAVLLVTPTSIMRGHVESVQFAQAADGGRHYKATVTVVEASDE